jgi:hypothetical protein
VTEDNWTPSFAPSPHADPADVGLGRFRDDRGEAPRSDCHKAVPGQRESARKRELNPGRLDGFFPPLDMGIVSSATGGCAVGFALLPAVRSPD